MTVFNKGNTHGLIVWIPNGGQTAPIQIAGEILEWKKAQKNPKKNIISDTINKTKPILNPLCTAKVWRPSKVASIITSHNQLIKEKKKKKKPKGKNFKNEHAPVLYSCNHKTVEIKLVQTENAIKNGHGLGLTKWNGCCW